MQQTLEKQVHCFIIDTASETAQEDVGRVHGYIAFGGQIFGKAMIREELRDHGAVAEACQARALDIPMSAQAQADNNEVIEPILLQSQP